MKDLRIINLRKAFTSHSGAPTAPLAVNDVNLEVDKGRLVTLLGPSGCGKTTLLRMIAGFESPTSGDIFFGERRVNDDPPNMRDAAMVFQSYAIFPHLNVFENVAFGLRIKRMPKSEIHERVGHMLELAGLSTLAQRSPGQLSGGQQQRVALARCMVTQPRLLLFDEPLSNLDAKLREQMRIEIRELQQRVGITTVYVTHDQIEAMSMSDLILVMNAGVVEQIGTPVEIYARPCNRFVAGFIGKANFVDAEIVDGSSARVGSRLVGIAPHDRRTGDKATLVWRPEALRIERSAGMYEATVRRAMFLGSIAEYLVEVPGIGELLIDQPNPAATELLSVGERAFVSPAPGAAVL